MTSSRSCHILLSFAIFAIALWLYTSTAVPGLIFGTAAESESAQLQRVANRLGIAHSTGYPLHTMIGYLVARLAEVFDHDAYTWITYTSAVASGLALVMFFHLMLRITTPPAALASTGLLMVTDTFWHISTVTETQALNAVSISGLLWLMVVHIQQPKKVWPLIGMAFLAGVGLANHRTSAFSIGAAGLSVLLTRHWLRLSWRQWLIVVLAFIIPLMSYGYMFWRVSDPFVVFSTRPTWFPSELDNGDVVDIIRGTLQDGSGLEGNLVWPTEDLAERWQFVRMSLQNDLPDWAVVLGLLGLALLSVQYWRLGVVLVAYFVVWIVFLMSWRLDWKSVIYVHALTLPLVMGIGVLAGWMVQRPARNIAKQWRNPVVTVLFALPVFAYATHVYSVNRPIRDWSNDTRGETYLAEIDTLPQDTWFFTGGWTADTFILLEYLDETGRRDVLPRGNFNVEQVADAARDTSKTVIIGEALRGFFGLYSGSTYFRDNNLAFSGTRSPLFFQVRPPYDHRLRQEANQTTVVDEPIAPHIKLYSYALEWRTDRLNVILYWQAVDATEISFAVFTHLRVYGTACDEDTLRSLIAQDDSIGTVRNMHPTNWWQTSEIVKDSYFIELPDGALPEGTALVIGMTQAGERVGEICLPVDDSRLR